MVSKIDAFKPIISILLKSTSIEEEVLSAQTLQSVYINVLDSIVKPDVYSNTQATHINTGIALSSQHALDCLQDPLRTVRFIKGTYFAIHQAIDKFPNEKIQLLYAGCGPGAPIIIPLLSLFTPNQISITLIDINETSIESVTTLISEFKLNDYFQSIQLMDATLYKQPENIPLHIVLSETMDKGLTKEPQVAITQNLAPQLVADGILIPAAINMYTELSFYSKEPYFDIYKNVLELGSEIKTANKLPLFSITKNIQNQQEFEFLSDVIEVPNDFSNTPDICIFADIIIFGTQKLLKAQSLISNPNCVTSLYNLKQPQYQLKYTIHDIPTWKVIEQ